MRTPLASRGLQASPHVVMRASARWLPVLWLQLAAIALAQRSSTEHFGFAAHLEKKNLLRGGGTPGNTSPYGARLSGAGKKKMDFGQRASTEQTADEAGAIQLLKKYVYALHQEYLARQRGYQPLLEPYSRLFLDDVALGAAIDCGGPFDDGVEPSPMSAAVHQEVQRLQIKVNRKDAEASDYRFLSAKLEQVQQFEQGSRKMHGPGWPACQLRHAIWFARAVLKVSVEGAEREPVGASIALKLVRLGGGDWGLYETNPHKAEDNLGGGGG